MSQEPDIPARDLSLSTAWRKAALEVDLPFGLTPRGRVLCADAAVCAALEAMKSQAVEAQVPFATPDDDIVYVDAVPVEWIDAQLSLLEREATDV